MTSDSTILSLKCNASFHWKKRDKSFERINQYIDFKPVLNTNAHAQTITKLVNFLLLPQIRWFEDWLDSMMFTRRLFNIFFKFPSRNIHYIQGQSPEPKLREYFYFIDHQGQVKLPDS